MTAQNQTLLDIIETATAGKTIVLVGLMGCGKSTIGRKLARALALPFFDSDDEIEKAAGRTITEIFAEFGEEEFRRGERQVIKRILAGPRCILATGGGAYMAEDTRVLIGEHAVSLWLNADLDTLMARVKKRPTRPLLKTPNPRATMQDLMEKRYPIYSQADLTYKTGQDTKEKVTEDVLELLASYGE